ncbi:MAG: hypothetical protein F4181_17480 [Proteobacteria bacterium]|nr:hypothetical protein [Pseudomonadota bacterium]
MRFHGALRFRQDSGGWRRYLALVAAVAGDDEEVAGVHCSWLDPVHPVLAPVSRPRKAPGRIHGLAVRFGEPIKVNTLLVGDGIETVLSLVTVRQHGALRTTVPSGTFAAAALSAGSLGAFVPPSHIARLIIAQDRDKAGGLAARRLQLRCTRLGIASAVLLPAGNDFNDDLRSFGPEPLATRLAPLVPT